MQTIVRTAPEPSRELNRHRDALMHCDSIPNIIMLFAGLCHWFSHDSARPRFTSCVAVLATSGLGSSVASFCNKITSPTILTSAALSPFASPAWHVLRVQMKQSTEVSGVAENCGRMNEMVLPDHWYVHDGSS